MEPWYKALADPAGAQAEVLRSLTQTYGKTEYGERCGAERVETFEEFQKSFPIVSYSGLQPYLEEVKRGNYSTILSEPVVRWVMTRGTTGKPKMIPVTQTHLTQILKIGSRGLLNFALRRMDFDVLRGGVLNLNFPSEVARLRTSRGEETYGYSSGTYAKLNPELGAARLVPRQEEIDALGGGISKKDWDGRFELVYQRAKDVDVRSVMGVTPVITAFAKYLKRRHRLYPKDVWRFNGLFCTSVPKIQTSYAPLLRRLYGEAAVVEMYTATEGVFAQQLGDQPYLQFNYDVYLFEVKSRRGVKMLHEMEAGECGKIIISSPLFPRYDIGDLVEAVGKGCFRVFGRARRLTVLEHVFFNLVAGRWII